MISVHGQNGRREVGLGYHRQENMDEIELEEGEACFNFEADRTGDPDIRLSYIGEKVQSLLGHFQKDFEGGVSAENLGAKFGGYGSFLPACPRSPVSRHVRSSPRCSKPESLAPPGAPMLEVKRVPSSIPSNAPCVKPESSMPTRDPKGCVSPRKNVCSVSGNGQENIPSKPKDQKNLKVRLKVGLENTLSHKSAEIYTGLGLDDSSSTDDSETESAHDHNDRADMSPTSILQIMTSFSSREMLLSPLPDDILELIKDEKLTTNMKSRSSDNISAAARGHVSDARNTDWKTLEKKEKHDRNVLSGEFTGENKSKVPNGCSLKGRPGVDSGVSVVVTSRSSKKERDEKNAGSSVDIPKRKTPHEPVTHWERFGRKEKSTLGDEKPEKINGDVTASCRDDLVAKEERASDKMRAAAAKAADFRSSSSKDVCDSGEKAKSRGTRIDCGESIPQKRSKGNRLPETATENLKIREGGGCPVTSSYSRVVHEDFDDRVPRSTAFSVKEKSSLKEGHNKLPNDFPHTKSGVINGNDMNAGLPPPAVIEENWVGCDKCQKWRLLPLGINTEDLPEKWTCSMLSWLPGSNRCSISEEETTNAVIASHQAPLPVAPNASGGVESTSAHTNVHRDGQDRNFLSGSSGKKKNGAVPADAADGAFSNAPKRKLHVSVKQKKKTEVSQLSSIDEDGGGDRVGGSGMESGDSKTKRRRETDEWLLKKSADEGSRRHSSEDHNGVKVPSLKGTCVNLTGRDKQMQACTAKSRNIKLLAACDGGDPAKRKRKSSDPSILNGNGRPEFAQDDASSLPDRKSSSLSETEHSRVVKRVKFSMTESVPPRREDRTAATSSSSLPQKKIPKNSTAASSSSKVLGSQRKEAKTHEEKESPVESVSSSPMRGGRRSSGDAGKIKCHSSQLSDHADDDRRRRWAPNGGPKEQLQHGSPRVPPVGERKDGGGNQTTGEHNNKQGGEHKCPGSSNPPPPPPVILRKESAALGVIREAQNLKHVADRLKSAGSVVESVGLYFETSLKFLHGASLLEACSGNNGFTRPGLTPVEVYSSTAKLCTFCAHEYEKLKDMAAATLAYKCTEVAYMRAVYLSDTAVTAACRADRQRPSQPTARTGESSSSSASDLDNLNHPLSVNGKANPRSPRGIMRNQSVGPANNHRQPDVELLLNFAHDVNRSMEATRKSRAAYEAACREQQSLLCDLSPVRTALNFHFHDMEGLLRLVRLAMEAIGRG